MWNIQTDRQKHVPTESKLDHQLGLTVHAFSEAPLRVILICDLLNWMVKPTAFQKFSGQHLK